MSRKKTHHLDHPSNLLLVSFGGTTDIANLHKCQKIIKGRYDVDSVAKMLTIIDTKTRREGSHLARNFRTKRIVIS